MVNEGKNNSKDRNVFEAAASENKTNESKIARKPVPKIPYVMLAVFLILVFSLFVLKDFNIVQDLQTRISGIFSNDVKDSDLRFGTGIDGKELDNQKNQFSTTEDIFFKFQSSKPFNATIVTVQLVSTTAEGDKIIHSEGIDVDPEWAALTGELTSLYLNAGDYYVNIIGNGEVIGRGSFSIIDDMPSVTSPPDRAASELNNVKDFYGCLNNNEAKSIQAMIDRAKSKCNLDIMILSTGDTEGKSPKDYADNYYDRNGYGVGNDKSGLLMLLNMNTQEAFISTTGRAIGIFTDDKIDDILDNIAIYFTSDDYYGACEKFVDLVELYASDVYPSASPDINRQIEIVCKDTYDDDSNNIYTIKGISSDGVLVWEKVWKQPATELSIASPYIIKDDIIYVVVTNNLYAIDVQTGDYIWECLDVGACSHAPVIDSDGTIYCTGAYGPFLSAIRPDGVIEWQIDDLDDFDIYWPYNVELEGDYIYVSFDSIDDGILEVDKQGRIVGQR